MTVLAALGAALSAWLAVRPPPDVRRGGPGPPGTRWPWWVAAATGGWVVVGPAVLVVAALAGGARALLAVRRRRRVAAATADRVLEACELLAADLATGRSPTGALTAAAESWPDLGPVAEAGSLGGDVPAAMLRLATRPGAGELRLVAAAWTVSHRTGAGLAAALDRVATTIRADRATGRVVEGELASARATARLVAALPLLVQLLGLGSGASPWGFLVGTPLGLACLAGGVGLGLVGLLWIERIADGVTA